MSGVVGLGGGIGASRLWRALTQAVNPAELTLVVNTGDDLWLHGLRICPDIDTTLYALSGRQDVVRGWGVRDESFRCMGALRGLGGSVWLQLGDLDLATHLLRTGLLRNEVGLAEVTRRLGIGMGVPVRVLPMSEDEVATRIETTDGQLLHYEEFLVCHQAEPPVARIHYDGIEHADPAPGVLAAIADADLVVLAPSNPLASIGPILAVRGMRQAVRETMAPVVAVSPIVSGVPISDPGEQGRATSRAALLRSTGLPPTASAVAGLYRDLASRFVLDTADAEEAEAAHAFGLDTAVVSTLLHCGAPAETLVESILEVRLSSQHRT